MAVQRNNGGSSNVELAANVRRNIPALCAVQTDVAEYAWFRLEVLYSRSNAQESITSGIACLTNIASFDPVGCAIVARRWIIENDVSKIAYVNRRFDVKVCVVKELSCRRAL